MDKSFYISKPSTTCSGGEEKLRANTKKKPLTLSSLKRNRSPPLIFQKKNEAGAPPPFWKERNQRSLTGHTLSPLPLINTNLFGSPVALPLSHKTATTYSFLLSQPYLLASRDLPSLSRQSHQPLPLCNLTLHLPKASRSSPWFWPWPFDKKTEKTTFSFTSFSLPQPFHW